MLEGGRGRYPDDAVEASRDDLRGVLVEAAGGHLEGMRNRLHHIAASAIP